MIKKLNLNENNPKWVVFGQVVSTVGVLIGLRLITEYLSPNIYGEYMLIIGMIMLLTSVFCNPIMQGLIKFVPYYVNNNQIVNFHRATRNILFKLTLTGCMSLVIATSLYAESNRFIYILLFIGIFIVEVLRMYNTTLLNTYKSHKYYAYWACMEAWGKPLIIIIFIIKLGGSVLVVLMGYFVASLINLFVMLYLLKSNTHYIVSCSGKLTLKDRNIIDTLRNDYWKYSWPLIPLGMIGWFNGVGDRYIIGILLSLNDVGIYAAIYGLISKPFLITSSVVELIYRPNYQNVVAVGNHIEQSSMFKYWFFLLVSINTILFMIVSFNEELITKLFLGENYHEGSNLVAWIALGYSLLTISYLFQRKSYAHSKTKHVLINEIVSTLVSVPLIIIFITMYGLVGAAMAIPIYFGFHLLSSLYFSNTIKVHR